VTAGYVDGKRLFIETITDQWPSKTKRHGRRYLRIGNLEWIVDDLIKLKRELFEFARGEAIA
jgi:hypothetical protein